MNVRIGINPLTWSNDDLPVLGADISLETCLEQAAATGFDGVELGHKFPRRASELRPLLARHGLALVSGWYSLRLIERDAAAEFEAMRAHFDLLQALDCDVMVCAEVSACVHSDIDTRLSRRPQLAPEKLARFADRLSALAAMMQKCGMRLAYHHHMGTVIQSEAEVDALMAACSADVELLLDTGHLTFAGGDAARAARKHATRIAHVHCKDVRADVLARVQNEDTSFLEAVLQGVFTVPGDGCIDYNAVFEPLRTAGYDGWLVIEAEQDPAIADPLTYATMGHAALAALTGRD